MLFREALAKGQGDAVRDFAKTFNDPDVGRSTAEELRAGFLALQLADNRRRYENEGARAELMSKATKEKDMKHPFRGLAVHSYTPNNKGALHIAYIGPVGKLAMHFTGKTRSEAEEKAEAFRVDAIDRNEAVFIANQEAAKKRAAERTKK
jgi:hypothetical protein